MILLEYQILHEKCGLSPFVEKSTSVMTENVKSRETNECLSPQKYFSADSFSFVMCKTLKVAKLTSALLLRKVEIEFQAHTEHALWSRHDTRR